MSKAYFEECRERFSEYTKEELVGAFNGDVGNPGWVSARGYFHAALLQTMEESGIDLTAIRTEDGFSWRHPVQLNENDQLVI